MTDEAPNPVYISVGHKIALDTAVKLALACAIKRVPEPIRQASNHCAVALRTAIVSTVVERLSNPVPKL